jgi:hypothetical protein
MYRPAVIAPMIRLATLLCVWLAFSAQAETRCLCDRRVTYDIVPPVKEVFPDGKVILLLAWNVSIGGREDINNIVGMGKCPTGRTKSKTVRSQSTAAIAGMALTITT